MERAPRSHRVSLAALSKSCSPGPASSRASQTVQPGRTEHQNQAYSSNVQPNKLVHTCGALVLGIVCERVMTPGPSMVLQRRRTVQYHPRMEANNKMAMRPSTLRRSQWHYFIMVNSWLKEGFLITLSLFLPYFISSLYLFSITTIYSTIYLFKISL